MTATPATSQTASTEIKRPARTYSISEKQTKRGLEYQVLHGNKIVARYATSPEAHAHLDRIFSKAEA